MTDQEKDDHEEFEYESHPVETEIFYVDLDLSTANGGRRERLKRKRSGVQVDNDNDGEDVSNSEQTPKPSTAVASVTTPIGDEDLPIDIEVIEGSPEGGEGGSAVTARATEIQILDLHGHNPLISYQNQIYHCTWSDMIGTAMFFSRPEGETEEGTVMSTNDFRLLSTSRIKLIGQKAILTGKPGRKRRRQAEDDAADLSLQDGVYDEGTAVMNGKSLGEIRSSNPKVNADIKRQAAFLEKMMDVKRAKGELDNVRTVFSQKRADTKIIQPRRVDPEISRPRQLSPSNMINEIEELNRKVVRGDATALLRLQNIYSTLEENALNGSSEANPSSDQPKS